MRVLIVDDDQGLCEGLKEFLIGSNFEVEIAFTGRKALEHVSTFSPDCILLDWYLPDMTGLELIPSLRSISISPIVMLSGELNPEHVVRSTKAGAETFLFKPLMTGNLLKTIENVISLAKPREVNIASKTKNRFVCLPSAAMREVYQKIEKISKFTDKTILVCGETGTGKEHVVTLLHEQSVPVGSPFIGVNCAAVPENLFESEIFGHEAGAFTDARQRRIGVLEAAAGGTVFLDEIGELSLPLQSKLLKVIEERKIRRLGGTKDIPLKSRIVAATNRDLADEVEKGRFRRDLYYRLKGYVINVPPLRQRPEDFPVLADFFHGEVCALAGEVPRKLHSSIIESLLGHRWPGNVRELENFIFSRFIDGPLDANGEIKFTINHRTREESAQKLPATLASRREVHRKAVLEALERHRGNKTRAAAELGITRQTLATWVKADVSAEGREA